MAFKGVILDVDGTLVLSNDAHANAWVEAFAKFGYEVKFEEVRPLMGMGGDYIIPKFAPGLSDEEGKGKEISSYRKEIVLDKYIPNVSPANGAREMVMKLQEAGKRIIIATSASDKELSALLKIAKVDDILSQDDATSSDDAENSKPAPDIVEAALKKFEIKPEEIVMIGDTPYDIQAANKAGVEVIAVRSGGFEDSRLSKAIAIYNDAADLVENFDSSTLASAG
ncbi:HAD family hydrolase [Calothrix parasitica NIES-267]|uniref:HAD family hydrolase n=1 Tax=Calothrix parasitica NIES-267 TaxID=1973488 RepID=A0A1Z4M1G3_9CYAN|nr:HAD family hydrolase [Calothrix parasitica NIES-267]